MAVKREQVVQTAEKYVARGKIEPAIREYRKLLEENPNDINTLNRVGDLYARIQRIDEAVDFFNQIAEQYAGEGFFVKAIAIYKKIIKLDPTRLDVYESLAELYHRQGLVTEARTQYQVLADYYQKHENATSTIAIYQKMAELEPNNPTYHVKLAELYHQQRLIDKAMGEYRIIAELMIEHGHPQEAAQVYERALAIDSSNLGFISDAALKLKTAAGPGITARFLAAAVERNPQAIQVARLVGGVAGLAGTYSGAAGAPAPQAGAPAAAAPEEPPAASAAPPAAPRQPMTSTMPPATAAPPATQPAPPPREVEPEGYEALPGTGLDFGPGGEDRPSPGLAAIDLDADFEIELDLGNDLLLDEAPSALLPSTLPAPASAPAGPPAAAGGPGAGRAAAFDDAGADAADDADAGAGVGDGFDDVFVLDIEDDEEPASLVKPPPDMLQQPRRPSWAQDAGAPAVRPASPASAPPAAPAATAPPVPPAAAAPPALSASPAGADRPAPSADGLRPATSPPPPLTGGLRQAPVQPPVHEDELTADGDVWAGAMDAAREMAAATGGLVPPPRGAGQAEPGAGGATAAEEALDFELIELGDLGELPDLADLPDLETGGLGAPSRLPLGAAGEPAPPPVTAAPPPPAAAAPRREELLSSLPAELDEPPRLSMAPLGAMADMAEAAEERAPDVGPPAIEIDRELLERTAAELIPQTSERYEDLVSEAEVLAKYGLEEKAAERLREAIRIKPRQFAAYLLLIQLHLERSRPARVIELANQVSDLAAELGDTEVWPKLRRRLLAAGYRLDGEQVAGAPRAAGQSVVPLPAAAPDVAATPGGAPGVAALPEAPPAPSAMSGAAGLDTAPPPTAVEGAAALPPGAAALPPGAAALPPGAAALPPGASDTEAPAAARRRRKASPEGGIDQMLQGLMGTSARPRRPAVPPAGAAAPPPAAGALPAADVPGAPAWPLPPAAADWPAAPEAVPAAWPAAGQAPAGDLEALHAAEAMEGLEMAPLVPAGPPLADEAPPLIFNPLDIGAMVESEDIDWDDQGPGPGFGTGTGTGAAAAVPVPAAAPAAAVPPPAAAAPASAGAAALDDTGMSWLDEADSGKEKIAARAASLFDDEDDFFDLAGELEQELSQEPVFQGEDLLVQQQEQSLEEIVEGFKRGVAEHLSPTDYDTHFNLGIAYREMGLLDEAIGEFQISAKDSRYLVSCCSMLGLCFLDKGLPELAIKWYRRGLEAEAISEEETLGLLYDMGCAHVAMGDSAGAYKTFVDVYGINTNYRDVVARIEELGHPH